MQRETTQRHSNWVYSRGHDLQLGNYFPRSSLLPKYKLIGAKHKFFYHLFLSFFHHRLQYNSVFFSCKFRSLFTLSLFVCVSTFVFTGLFLPEQFFFPCCFRFWWWPIASPSVSLQSHKMHGRKVIEKFSDWYLQSAYGLCFTLYLLHCQYCCTWLLSLIDVYRVQNLLSPGRSYFVKFVSLHYEKLMPRGPKSLLYILKAGLHLVNTT